MRFKVEKFQLANVYCEEARCTWIFSDTSPLKVFASGLRGKPRAYTAYKSLAPLTIMNIQDRCLLYAVLAACKPSMLSMHVQVILQGSVSMAKRNVRYPRTIGFRVTDETWFAIQREISNTDLTPHDWCRMVVLDSLNRGFGLTKKEHIFFQQAAAIRYLVANGFQLLADDRLTTEEGKKPACCPKKRSM